jgi:hypothetical protein
LFGTHSIAIYVLDLLFSTSRMLSFPQEVLLPESTILFLGLPKERLASTQGGSFLESAIESVSSNHLFEGKFLGGSF